ncbi:MAG: hypothetical protein KME30_24710 [Iphinoe sp. HA4291-MV1]|nr:hypothetical protein [Iphinoe sp. HA4291-MV1]
MGYNVFFSLWRSLFVLLQSLQHLPGGAIALHARLLEGQNVAYMVGLAFAMARSARQGRCSGHATRWRSLSGGHTRSQSTVSKLCQS